MSALDEKRFEALGAEWTVRFDFNAMCSVEESSGRAFMEVAAPFLQDLDESDRADPAKLSAAAARIHWRDLRLILWEGLRSQQPTVTEHDTGKLISAIGLSEAAALVSWAILKALGPGGGAEPEVGESPLAKNPPRAERRRQARKSG